MFADAPFRAASCGCRRSTRSTGRGSWRRSVYYVWAALRLGGARPAGRVLPCRPAISATSMPAGSPAAIGLPVDAAGRRHQRERHPGPLLRHRPLRSAARSSPTTSPSMDIQVASNFERLLLELEGSDAERTRGRMQAFAQSGGFALDGDAAAPVRRRQRRPGGGGRHHRRHAAQHRRAGRSAHRRRRWPWRPVIDRRRACPW